MRPQYGSSWLMKVNQRCEQGISTALNDINSDVYGRYTVYAVLRGGHKVLEGSN